MGRKVIEIDESRCDGCGLCATACHEGVIGIVDGKAKLLREDQCDGMGDCLPACPKDAIHFIERDAVRCTEGAARAAVEGRKSGPLSNFPIQLKLAPVQAPCFNAVDLLIAADCTAFACANFREQFIEGRTTLVGCPKLDGANYAEKVAAILQANDIRSVTLTRMRVPCCGGLERMAREALKNCGKDIPLTVATIGVDGETVLGG